MADDDDTEHLMMLMAAHECGLDADFEFFGDGAHLMVHLERVLASGELPDLLILDLRMPRLNGHQTLELLQQHAELWKIPVVVFTSSTRPSDRDGAKHRGAHWYQSKPSDFSVMVEFVASLPELANAQQERHSPLRPENYGATDGDGALRDPAQRDIVGTAEQALRCIRASPPLEHP